MVSSDKILRTTNLKWELRGIASFELKCLSLCWESKIFSYRDFLILPVFEPISEAPKEIWVAIAFKDSITQFVTKAKLNFWIRYWPPHIRYKEIQVSLDFLGCMAAIVKGSNTARAAGTFCLQFPGRRTVAVNFGAALRFTRLCWSFSCILCNNAVWFHHQ